VKKIQGDKAISKTGFRTYERKENFKALATNSSCLGYQKYLYL